MIMPIAEETINKQARFNFRLPAEIKERIEKAAIVSGVTVTDFAITALADSADEVLENNTRAFFQIATAIFFSICWKTRQSQIKHCSRLVEEYKRRVISK